MKEENTKRKDAIKKSINLIGWTATWARIKTEEDKVILQELAEESDRKYRAQDDALLEKHHIQF